MAQNMASPSIISDEQSSNGVGVRGASSRPELFPPVPRSPPSRAPRAKSLRGIHMKKLVAMLLGIFLTAPAFAADPVPLHWLDSAPPPTAAGVSWGVPWPK